MHALATHTRKWIGAALLLPLALFLTACKFDMTVNLAEDGSGSMDILVSDTTGEYSGLGMTCDSLAEMAGGDEEFDGLYTIEDVSNGGNLSCRISMPHADDLFFPVDNGDGTYTISEYGSGDYSTYDGVTTTITFVLPGRVIDVSGGGRIEGNSVIFDSAEPLVDGFEVTYEVAGASPTPVPTTTSPQTRTTDPETPNTFVSDTPDKGEDTGDKKDDDGFPMWAWFAIGGGALLLIGGTAFAVSRKKKNNGGNPPFGGQPGPYAPNAYGQPQQFGQQAYGTPSAPTAAMPGQPTEQFGQPTEQFGQPTQQFGQPTEQLPNPNGNPNPWTPQG